MNKSVLFILLKILYYLIESFTYTLCDCLHIVVCTVLNKNIKTLTICDCKIFKKKREAIIISLSV